MAQLLSHRLVVESIAEPVIRAAQLAVAARAESVEDCRFLLDHLGIGYVTDSHMQERLAA